MKKLIMTLSVAALLSSQIFAVPMDKTHPSLTKPNMSQTNVPMDKTHPSLVNPNTRPPMDKTHPSLTQPGYDWTHDGWYEDDGYYKHNWGYSKQNFKNWLKKHPEFSKKNKKALEKLYKEQIVFERKLRKLLSRHSREISVLPAYRKSKDSTGKFIDDFMNRREVLHGYRLSPALRSELTRQERVESNYFRLADSLRK